MLLPFVLLFAALIVVPLPAEKLFSTIIKDRNGEVIYAFLTPDEKWRMDTRLEEISPLLRKAIIAKEDKYFYYHPGINPLAVIRAVWNNISKGRRTSGASTITMQVAKALDPGPRTYVQKFKEMFRALQLELHFTKDEILRLYLNMVPYGGNIEGVKAAALLYFNKSPDHLSLAEITALSIIPNKPSKLVIGKHNDKIVEERNVWLKRFLKNGIFSEKEIEDALEEPLNAYRREVPRHASHLSWKLKKGGGIEIVSTIDMRIQTAVEKLVADYARSLRSKRIHNAAAVVIDNETREIVAYVGSADFFDVIDHGQVNGAAAVRQPGSTLKPLVYALGIDHGFFTPAAVIEDVALNFSGYAPENYDRKFNGKVSMEYALEHSLNIPAVRALKMVGLEAMLDALSRAEFMQVKKDRLKLGLSMVLGGCGATLEELTGLYAAFANEGVYISPKYRIDAREGTAKTLFSKEATYMITDILSKVNRPDFPLNWQATEKMPRISWKTGTSYGRRDAWSIGYNKKYTVGVWAGNFSGVGVPDLNGAGTATPLLFRIFNVIDYDSDREWFSMPEGIDIRMVCSETGMIPSGFCTNLISDEFIPLISSTLPCDHMTEVPVSADEKISYCIECMPAAGYKKKLYRNYSQDMQEYLLERNMAFERIPPHNPECQRIFKSGEPVIVSPVDNFEYFISKHSPEPLMLSCKASLDASRVYWYVNDKLYKSAGPTEKLFFMPEEGRIKISCSDDKGRNRDIYITVKMVDL